MQGMVINMEEAKLQTLAQVKAFLDGTNEIAFQVPKAERNQFIERVLKRFGYARHGWADKGVLLRYFERMTGLSRQQVTRLMRQYRKDGKLSKRLQRAAPANGFASRYREGQEDQLGALGIVVNIIVLWNTIYIDAALTQMRQEGHLVLDEDVARLSPFVHEHINLLGRYSFAVSEEVIRGELRPLRNPNDQNA